MTHTATRIPAGEYTAIIKPKSARGSARAQPGVILVLQPSQIEQMDQVFAFSSWRFLRESLRVFGLASAKELDTADVRLARAATEPPRPSPAAAPVPQLRRLGARR